MKLLKNQIKNAGSIVLLVISSGCATHGYLTVTKGVPDQTAKVPPSAVKVLQEGSPPTQPFDVIGQITISLVPGSGPGPVNFEKDEHLHKASIERMKQEASAMGGNALMGIYTYKIGDYDMQVKGKFPSFITGLVVNLLEEGQASTHPQGGFVIGVAVADMGETNVTKQEFAKKWAVRFAQIQLAQKGYYTLPELQDLRDHDFATLSRSQPSEVASLGGREAGLILGLERLSRHRHIALLPGLFGTGESDGLAAAIFSKSTGQVSWSNAATGSGATGWLVSMFAPRTKEAIALNEAITEVLKEAPELASSKVAVKYVGDQIRER